MEFSTSGNQMVMQSFEPNREIFGFQPQNPNLDHWQVDGFSLSLSKPVTSSHQEQLFMDDGSGRLNLFQSSHQRLRQEQPLVLKRSRYLVPAQELLNEFCGIDNTLGLKKKEQKENCKWDEGGPSSMHAMDLVELQERKAKLLFMLEEVYRRYRRYCDQMKAVVSSFEAVAGEGSAMVYSTLASKAMSRHFRCLKDGITRQIQGTKMAMGEREAVASGTTKGETPRLKKLEQCFRQQKAFQQAGFMESQPWRPPRGLPERSVSVLRAWLFEHFLHPYPSDVDKHILARQTGLSRSQVSNWFINARVRLWKPMVEEMYMEELKKDENSNFNSNPNINASSLQLQGEEQKPVPSLLSNDSDSLSSIVNNHHHLNANPNFGVVDMDFTPYSEGTGVSLTLGLQHQEQSLYFSRDHIDEDRAVQFSILDDEGQNLIPYRSLMGGQLLHDLTG